MLFAALFITLTTVQSIERSVRVCLVNDVFLTCDFGSERAARNVLVVYLDNDAVVSGGGGQVGHGAGPVFVVLACNLCLGGTLHR